MRSPHVMFQPERVSNLVGRNKADSASHVLVAQLITPGSRINRSRLYPHPSMQQRHHVVPPNHVSLYNLPGTRINHRGTHRICLLGRRIGDNRITSIVYVKIFITFRGIFCDNSIFKSCSLKCGLPIPNSGFNLFPPLFRGRRIYIKHDRFYRLYDLSSFIFLYIFRFGFQSPTMNEFPFFHSLLCIIKIYMLRCKESHTRVGETWFHRNLRQ